MTPDLALTLSFEGIGLLTRVTGGWHLLGEVTLDSPDLPTDLATLRAKAVDVAGEDFATALVLPNDQIKYLTLPVGRMTDKKRREKAEEALEAATPYRADQLVYDLAMLGRTPQVAAVARDTLAEAEAFAMEYDFNPVGFTAIPPEDSFAKAPDFGLTENARQTGIKTKPDATAILIVGEGPLPEAAPAAVPEPAPQPEPKTTQTAPVDTPSPVVSEPSPASTTHADAAPQEPPKVTPAVKAPETEPAPATSRSAVTETAPQPAKTAPEADKVPEKALEPERASFASIRAQKGASDSGGARGLSGVTRQVSGTNAPSIPTETSKDGKAPQLRFDPAKAVAGLKAETPASATQSGNAQDAVEKDDPADTTFASARSKTKVAGPAPVAAKKDPKPKTKKAQARAANAQERQKLTVFGSRQTEVGGKPRHLGLILTTLLLVFLAIVALWASLTLEDGVAGLFGSDTEDAPIEVAVTTSDTAPTEATVDAVPTEQTDVAQTEAPEVPELDTSEPLISDLAATDVEASEPVALPAPAPEAPLVVTVPDGMTPNPTDGVNTAVLEPLASDSITDSAEVEMLMDEGFAETLDPRDAEAKYAVTGIWQLAPEQPLDLASDSSDDIYIASIDQNTLGLDAVALPAPEVLDTDLPARAQVNPVAADTNFDLDARGLVVATAEGALNPEGILVYLGRPPVFPAAYPKRIKVGEEPQVSAEDVTRLAAFRPKMRPSDLLEQSERATYGGLTLQELASIRPSLRPDSAKLADEANRTPTELAVKASLRPRAKPANIAQLAARAAPETAVVTAAAVPAAASVVPDIPTTASVARQATIKNAINLNKVNLIGVYGTASNRRALVRLSSGRYKKVQVGDRIDGGKVSAIGEDELRYTKSGRNLVLKMPKDS